MLSTRAASIRYISLTRFGKVPVRDKRTSRTEELRLTAPFSNRDTTIWGLFVLLVIVTLVKRSLRELT